MTRDETRNAILIMEAYMDGYEIQLCGKHWNPRESLKPDWSDTEDPCWDFDNCYYRRKPAAKLRSWTADEVPLGAWIRYKRALHDRSILAWTSNQSMFSLTSTEIIAWPIKYLLPFWVGACWIRMPISSRLSL